MVTLKPSLPIALALLLALGGQAFAAEPLPGANVDSLLTLAKERNPEYASMRQEATAAEARPESAGALPDPVLRTELQDVTNMGTDARPSLSPSRVGSTKYTVMQSVPFFGKRDLKREIAEHDAEGARGRANGTWAELSSRIKTTYAQLYSVTRVERLMRETLNLTRSLEKVAQVRYAGGLAAQQDAVRAQVEQTNMQSELLNVGVEKQRLQSRLNALLARPAKAPLAEAQMLRRLPAPAQLDYTALEERVKARNPLLFAEDARIKAAEKNRDLTYRNRYPDFTFGVSPIQRGTSVREWEVMVELNIPLQQGSRRAQEREAEAMLSAAQARKDALANQVLSDLSENLAGIEAARQTAQLATNSLLPQAEVTFQSALAGYQNGKVDFATLLDAQRQIRQAQQNQIKAQADAQMRLAELEKLLGEDL